AGVVAARVAQRRMSSMVAAEMFGPRRVRVRQGAPTDGPQPAAAEPGAAIEGEIVSPR
ncbi:FxsA family protein, partial [Micromonospora echinofusca]|nr:FxsA family protein [Micromonospora echinofusca]